MLITPVFLIASAVLVVATLTATRAATPATRRRARDRRTSFVVRHPELANYGDVAARLADDLDDETVAEIVEGARSRGVPAPLLNGWVRRHGATTTADAVRAGLTTEQLRRHAHSLTGLDLDAVALQAELHAWASGAVTR